MADQTFGDDTPVIDTLKQKATAAIVAYAALGYLSENTAARLDFMDYVNRVATEQGMGAPEKDFDEITEVVEGSKEEMRNLARATVNIIEQIEGVERIAYGDPFQRPEH